MLTWAAVVFLFFVAPVFLGIGGFIIGTPILAGLFAAIAGALAPVAGSLFFVDILQKILSLFS